MCLFVNNLQRQKTSLILNDNNTLILFINGNCMEFCFIYVQPRPQGLLAFQYGGGSGEDPGTQQNHVTKISNEDGNVFKMAAKAK